VTTTEDERFRGLSGQVGLVQLAQGRITGSTIANTEEGAS